MAIVTVSPENGKRLKLAAIASVITAGSLILAKLAAWFMTGSVSILASLIDSVMDSLASLINLLAIRYALQPADAEHRFGHGKAEPLAGLAQAAFISGSAVFLVLHAVDRLRYPHSLEHLATGIGIMVFSIVMTLGLLAIQRHVIKKTGSTAIRADALHYATDLLTNVSIILALFLASLGWTWADPVFAIGVAIYIFYSAARIGYDAFQILMDRELPPEIQGKIRTIALSQAGVKGIHDLRTRQSGPTRFIQLHVELDDNLPLTEAHTIADGVERAIRAAVPGADVIVHEDPASRTNQTGRNKGWSEK
jgi:ferrous-iron efflux pump FieF